MAFTKEELRKAIKDILKDADLDNMSAKKVRLSLQEKYDADLSDRKKEIDELVMELIEEMQDSQEADESSEEEEIEEPPPKKKKPSAKATISKPKPKPKPAIVNAKLDSNESSEEDDEEVAQKLQQELNGGRRTRFGSTPKKVKKERKVKEKGERKGSGYGKPCLLSPELADIMGAEQMARNEVVKRMWEIIKERNLQDPKNRSFMLCDDQLYPLFGKKKVKTFGMMKYLKNHIKDAKDVYS